MIRYKIDILESLKNKGFSTYRIRKEKIFGQRTLKDFRDGQSVLGKETLNTLCRLLNCDVGDILEYIPDSETELKDQ